MLLAATPILAVILPPVPPLFWHFHDAVPPGAQVLPVGGHIHRLRIPPAQPDDGHHLRFRPCPAPPASIAHAAETPPPTRFAAAPRRAHLPRLLRRCLRRRLHHHCCTRSKQLIQLRRVMGKKILTQCRNRLVFEEQRLGQRTQALLQLVGQLHRQDGINPIVLQRRLRIYLFHRQLQQRGELPPQILLHLLRQAPRINSCRLGFCSGCLFFAAAQHNPSFHLNPFSSQQRPAHARHITFPHQHLVTAERQTTIKRLQPRARLHRLHPRNLSQPLLRGPIHLHPPCLPQRPVDRTRPPSPLPRLHQPVPVPRKLIHEPVARRVIPLPYVPHRSRNRGKQHKEIQSLFPAGLLQVVRPQHLRPQHLRKFFLRLLHKKVIRDHPRAVHDPVQLPVLLLDPPD